MSPDVVAELNGRLAALERMVASVVSTQERDHRAFAVEQGSSLAVRAEMDERLTGLERTVASLGSKAALVASPAVTTVPARERTADERYLEALGFAERGEWTKAEFAFDTFVVNNPGHPRLAEARHWLGRSLAGQGKPAQAAKVFLSLYEKDPTSPLAIENLFALAEALVSLGPASAPQACDVYAQIIGDFSASLSVERRQKLTDQRIALNCKN